MIKDCLTQVPSFDKSFLLDNEIIFRRTKTNGITKEKNNKNFFYSRIIKRKKAEDFSSLERIRIVVDGLIGDVNEIEICKNEGISHKVYLQWKGDFLKAFKEYSKIETLNKAISSKNKELILREVGQKAFSFFDNHIDVESVKNLVIPKGKILSNYSNFSNVDSIVLLNRVNNFRTINKQFEEVNSMLQNGGIFMGCYETFTCRLEKKSIYKIPVIKHLYFGLEFIFKRVFPKLPYLKKIYFSITKGKNRFLSKAEVLGRLVSCGFDIIDYKCIDGMYYFAVKKVKEPVYDMNPSYGPLFKMQRVGKNGKMIGVYKLRTMHPYSEYLQDYVLKLNGYAETGKPADDFRLVPWGKFLRRYWLDELPQLINVIKGELKLVGVRPVSKRYLQDIPNDIREMRLTQKPGCVPPYVALNRVSSVESVIQAEKEYLEEKIRNPYFTDTKFFLTAIYNILFKNKRSA